MARGNPFAVPRVFLDSGVLLEGILAPWSASRAVLILSRRKVFKIVLAKYVQGEVEDNLLELLVSDSRLANDTINAYSTLLRLLSPEFVLVSAMKATPDWFLTTNTRHFTKQVALRTQLKILTPQEFLTSIRVLS
jgi:hypothetical protein